MDGEEFLKEYSSSLSDYFTGSNPYKNVNQIIGGGNVSDTFNSLKGNLGSFGNDVTPRNQLTAFLNYTLYRDFANKYACRKFMMSYSGADQNLLACSIARQVAEVSKGPGG